MKEQLHYANGTCDLAMKHRNTAEAAVRQDAKKIARLTAALEDIADTFTHERWCRCGDALRQVARAALACRTHGEK